MIDHLNTIKSAEKANIPPRAKRKPSLITSGRYKFDNYGALKSPVDPSDYIFERIAQGPVGFYLSEMPEVFDLRTFARPARDQGSRGTCAAFTAATIKEIQETRDCGFEGRMSPEFIYHHRDNKPANGMYGRNVFQIMQKIGSVPEEMYPYDTNDKEIPKAELYEFAANYRIANFARVTTIDGLKRALLEMGPCYLQLPLCKARPEFWKCDVNETANGGHAVAAVGYNTQGFILMNSWGPKWNGDGCIIFPYSDWDLHWECWVSVDEKSKPAILTISAPYKLSDNRYPSFTNIVVKKRNNHWCVIL